MAYLRFGDHISLYLLLCLAISECQAIMLAQMFRPGCDDKRFDIPMYVLNITVDAPSSRSVATPNSCVSANGSEKFCGFLWGDLGDRWPAVLGTRLDET